MAFHRYLPTTKHRALNDQNKIPHLIDGRLHRSISHDTEKDRQPSQLYRTPDGCLSNGMVVTLSEIPPEINVASERVQFNCVKTTNTNRILTSTFLIHSSNLILVLRCFV